MVLLLSQLSKRIANAVSGYEETRKKSGPKQGYVKKLEQKSQTLEQRLAMLEKLLATHQGQATASPSTTTSSVHLPTPPGISPLAFENLSAPGSTSTDSRNQFSLTPDVSPFNPNDMFTTQAIFPDSTLPDGNNDLLNAFPLFRQETSAPATTSIDPFAGISWDMVSLGLQEELPPEELTDRLYLAFELLV
jgi:hypothetical protein